MSLPFLAYCQTKPSWSLPKISKIVEASALKEKCQLSQSTQGFGSVVSLAMFYQSLFLLFQKSFLGQMSRKEKVRGRGAGEAKGESRIVLVPTLRSQALWHWRTWTTAFKNQGAMQAQYTLYKRTTKYNTQKHRFITQKSVRKRASVRTEREKALSRLRRRPQPGALTLRIPQDNSIFSSSRCGEWSLSSHRRGPRVSTSSSSIIFRF